MGFFDKFKNKSYAEKWKKLFMEECNDPSKPHKSVEVHKEWNDKKDPLWCLAGIIMFAATKQSVVELTILIIQFENSSKSLMKEKYTLDDWIWYRSLARQALVEMGYDKDLIERFDKVRKI